MLKTKKALPLHLKKCSTVYLKRKKGYTVPKSWEGFILLCEDEEQNFSGNLMIIL